jgi:hypothetical protein
VFCVVIVACAGNDQATRHSVSAVVDTVAGIERVTSSGEPETLPLTPVLELGSEGGAAKPAEDEFAWVSAVSIGPDGLVYVADLGNHRIAVFDIVGVRQRVIGRQGRGPGEFETLYSIAWINDNLATLDLGNGRFALQSASGDWFGEQPAPGRLVASPVTHRLYQVGPAEVYQWAYVVVDGILEASWIHQGTGGPVVQWARRLEAPEAPFPDKVVCTMGRGFSWFDHPYVPRILTHPARGDRSIVAITSAYRLAVVDSEGDTLRIIERGVDPPRLGDAEWNLLIDRFSDWLKDKTLSACQPRSLERPLHKPAIESLMVGVDGRIWVERNLEYGTLWEVFDARGHLLASVPGFRHDRERTVPWLSSDLVAWVSRGPSDFPIVHVARLGQSTSAR